MKVTPGTVLLHKPALAHLSSVKLARKYRFPCSSAISTHPSPVYKPSRRRHKARQKRTSKNRRDLGSSLTYDQQDPVKKARDRSRLFDLVHSQTAKHDKKMAQNLMSHICHILAPSARVSTKCRFHTQRRFHPLLTSYHRGKERDAGLNHRPTIL
jgi:hypothetical protein